MKAAPAPTKQQTIERHYFEMFRKAYPLPPGDIIYVDKPDVLINSTPTLGIEITNFYVKEGASPAGEQVQSKLRTAAVIEGHRLYQEGGGRNIDLTFSFDKKNPIKNVKTLAKELVAFARRVEGGPNGAIRKDMFKDIPEIDFAYLYAQELQFSDESDPKFPNGQPDPSKSFAAFAEYRNRREARALEAGVYKPLQTPGRWKVGQGHSFGLMSIKRLTEIVAEKEAKAQQYITCDAYWLLIIVDYIDAAQEQEIRIDGLTVESKMFQKILIYKPHYEHIVNVGIR